VAISKNWVNLNEYENMSEKDFNKNYRGLRTSISKSGDFDNHDHNQNYLTTNFSKVSLMDRDR
jgi:hypothetical protein